MWKGKGKWVEVRESGWVRYPNSRVVKKKDGKKRKEKKGLKKNRQTPSFIMTGFFFGGWGARFTHPFHAFSFPSFSEKYHIGKKKNTARNGNLRKMEKKSRYGRQKKTFLSCSEIDGRGVINTPKKKCKKFTYKLYD